jgi:hypothetical protein
MPWLDPIRRSPDPTCVRPATALPDGWFALTVHPYAVAWHGPVGAAAIAAWGRGLDLQREPAPLRIDPAGGDEIDIVLDFGTELEGVLEMALTTGEAVAVSLAFGESPWEAREWNLPTTCKEQRPRKSHWQVGGAGEHRHRAEAGGFRFARIRIIEMTSAVTLRARVNAVFPAAERLGDFTCDDARLQRIWQTSLYTALVCTRPDTIWDGIKRDRIGWYGDARITQDTLAWGYDLPRPALTMLATLPDDRWANEIPNYSFDALAMLRRHVQRFGIAGTGEAWAKAKAFLTWVRGTQVDGDGLIVMRDGVGLFFGIGFLDWTQQPIGGRLEELFCVQAAWLECLRDAAWCAQWIGERNAGEDAQAWRSAADRLAGILKTRFRATGRGFHHTLNLGEAVGTPWRMPLDVGLHKKLSYEQNVRLGPSGATRHSAARAWWAGLSDGTVGPEIAAVLNDAELPQIVTSYYWYYTAMAQAGGGDPAGALAQLTDWFGPMIEDHDAATIWESYEPAVRGIAAYGLHGWPKSLCHGWGSGTVGFCGRWVLGIETVAPGMARVKLDPCLDMVFSARVPSPFGEIQVERGELGGVVRYGLPAGIEAEVVAGARVEVVTAR